MNVMCVAPALRKRRESEVSLCRMVSQSSLGNLPEIHCLECPSLGLWILAHWLVRGVRIRYSSVLLFPPSDLRLIEGPILERKLSELTSVIYFHQHIFWKKKWIRSFHSFYVVIIITAVFINNWLQAWHTSAYKVSGWKRRSGKLASWASTGPAWSSRFLPPHYLVFPFSSSLLP